MSRQLTSSRSSRYRSIHYWRLASAASLHPSFHPVDLNSRQSFRFEYTITESFICLARPEYYSASPVAHSILAGFDILPSTNWTRNLRTRHVVQLWRYEVYSTSSQKWWTSRDLMSTTSLLDDRVSYYIVCHFISCVVLLDQD